MTKLEIKNKHNINKDLQLIIAEKIMGVIFFHAQPDGGDIFGFCDEIKEEMAEVSINAFCEHLEKQS